MNKLFKDIRHSDVDAVRVAISKNITVVNEVYTAKAPKKDIGQSPLQVAIKCGEFEIIELLLENGADPDFMENPELVPPHSVCMSVLHDAIIGVFSSLCYEQYISSEKYVNLIKMLLEKGANPNRKTSSKVLPIGTTVSYSLRSNPHTRRETKHFDLSPVTAVTTVTAYCALKNIVTAVTVVTRSTVLCRFQQSKNVSICISKYGIW